MRSLVRLASVALVASILAACGGGGGGGGGADGRFECFTVPSAAIGASLSGNAATGTLCALLPASYARSPDRSYPAIYFLHGFGESPEQIRAWTAAADEAMAGGQELVIVALQGGNALGGSFYVDSPVSGQFETWVTQE